VARATRLDARRQTRLQASGAYSFPVLAPLRGLATGHRLIASMPVKRDQSFSTTDAQGAAKRSKVEGGEVRRRASIS
jgi:hypothetical protein